MASRSGVFGGGALSKDGFRQQVTQWASACLPCLCPFCLVVTLILADSFAFSRTVSRHYLPPGTPASTGNCAACPFCKRPAFTCRSSSRSEQWKRGEPKTKHSADACVRCGPVQSAGLQKCHNTVVHTRDVATKMPADTTPASGVFRLVEEAHVPCCGCAIRTEHMLLLQPVIVGQLPRLAVLVRDDCSGAEHQELGGARCHAGAGRGESVWRCGETWL